jgi:hypothetical protein
VALMAFQTHVSLNYATHLPCLMRALTLTNGPVLELGLGLFSTPYLHYACRERWLVSYDNDAAWVSIFKPYETLNHRIRAVSDWAEAPIELRAPWSVALVDHSPSARRVVDIKRLADCAMYIIVHDTNGRYEKDYHYSTIYPLFRYRADWTGDGRHAAVLSNFVDLERFWD